MKPRPPCTWIAARVMSSQLSVARYFASGVSSRIRTSLRSWIASQLGALAARRCLAAGEQRLGSSGCGRRARRCGRAARGCLRGRSPCARAGSSSAAARRSGRRTACARARSATAESSAASAMPTPWAATPSRALFISVEHGAEALALLADRATRRRRSKRHRGRRRAVDAELLLEPRDLDARSACRRAACAGTGRARGRWSCRGSRRRCRRRARAPGAPPRRRW